MGREQGDELETPVFYVAEIDGESYERPAYTPADHVNLQAAGWRRKDSKSEAPKQAPRSAPASQPAASGDASNAEGGRS